MVVLLGWSLRWTGDEPPRGGAGGPGRGSHGIGVQRTGERITLGVEIWSGSATERLVRKKAGNAELRDEVAFCQASPRRTISTNTLRMM
jgi:hypothetical protein